MTARAKKESAEPLVFSYRRLPYGRYSVAQIVVFVLFAILALLYYQYYSPWRGGFAHSARAVGAVLGFLCLYLLLALAAPLRDLLIWRNERVEIEGDRVRFFNLLGRKRFEAKISEVEPVIAGVPITSRTKRYVFKANGKSFYFSADISELDRLVRLLGVEK